MPKFQLPQIITEMHTAGRARITELLMVTSNFKLKYKLKYKQRQLWNVNTRIHGMGQLMRMYRR